MSNGITMKLLFELSGENPTLPFAELGCIGRILDRRKQVAVVESGTPEDVQRLAMTHRVLEYLGECEPDIRAFRQLLQDLALGTNLSFSGRIKKIHGSCAERDSCSQKEFERMIGTMIAGPVSLKNPEVEFRAILSEDRCYFGRVVYSFERGMYDERNPGKRTFFHPGVMMPRMARTLVNIAGVRTGDRFFDPFCGTGGILIEAGLLGADTLGGDFDLQMIAGSRKNTEGSDLILGDASHIPVSDHAIDAVVTDFPYGQSVCIRKEDSMDRLYADSLLEIRRVLKERGKAVVVTHRDISAIAAEFFTIAGRHTQRVHKSLTRHIIILNNEQVHCV